MNDIALTEKGAQSTANNSPLDYPSYFSNLAPRPDSNRSETLVAPVIKTALLGNPVQHSPSPLMYREYATACGYEAYEHQRLTVASESEFWGEVLRLFGSGYSGLNVTAPYKRLAWSLADRLDESASSSGAVNVLVSRQGQIVGYNTDIWGAGCAMKVALGRELVPDDVVTVIGTGGAGRAVVAFAATVGATIRVLYRKPESERTQSLRADFPGVQLLQIDDFVAAALDATLICQATPVGLRNTETPIPNSLVAALAKARGGTAPAAFCVVISKETAFLFSMKRFGARISSGVDMMLFQGVAAFEIWTGSRPDKSTIQLARAIVTNWLPDKAG